MNTLEKLKDAAATADRRAKKHFRARAIAEQEARSGDAIEEARLASFWSGAKSGLTRAIQIIEEAAN